jgi:hypothetical protein
MGCATLNFKPAAGSPFAVGPNAHYVGVGRFNADNHLDIVTTDKDRGSITILLGNGSGYTIAPGSPISVGADPITSEVGDLNNDHKADIVVTNQGSHSLTILLGNGDGAFTPAPGAPVAVNVKPRGVAIDHFNGDINLDLVVCNGESDNLTILLGNGDGTFIPAPGSPLAGGDAPFHAVVGRFNADAYKDLAVANLADGTVSIFLGKGDGGFTQFGAAIPAGKYTSFIAAGLFDADTNLDLAVTNRVSNNVIILLGDGNGGFRQADGSPYTVGASPMAVAVGDLNLDGNLDIVVPNEDSANISVFLGKGNGDFGSPFTISTGRLPTHLALADFNEDNKPDIATSNGGDSTLTILLNACSDCQAPTAHSETIPANPAGSPRAR